MRERPIIMSGESVRAIIAGTKTQTRRVAKPEEFGMTTFDELRDDLGKLWSRFSRRRHPRYGEVGDRLWVRETWCLADQDSWKMDPCPGRDGRPHGPVDGSGTPTFAWYEATDEGVEGERGRSPWRSPLHMPRWASRLSLRVTDVRVQRLHAISEADARAEGVDRDEEPCDHTRLSCEEVDCMGPTFRSSFCERWDAINGKRAPWDSNPWVWAITFERTCPGTHSRRG